MANFARQYWDSNVFLSLLTGTMPDRVEVIRQLVSLRQRDKITIVTSTCAIAEMRSTVDQAVAPADFDTVMDMFMSGDIDLWAVTERIAREAAWIGQQHPVLLPLDCLHIATAIEANVDVLFTYDGSGRRRRPGDMLAHDHRIGTPPLRIHSPFVPEGPRFAPESPLDS